MGIGTNSTQLPTRSRKMQSIKCVAVGDSGVGKGSMLFAYATGKFPRARIPADIPDNYSLMTMVDGGEWTSLDLYFTPGSEDYDQLRPLLWYPQTNLFLVCFSVVELGSFESVPSWVKEIRQHCGWKVPFLLCGTKTDLRNHPEVLRELAGEGCGPVTFQQGLGLAREVGAAGYVECSAWTRAGLKGVFEEVIASVVKERKRSKVRNTLW